MATQKGIYLPVRTCPRPSAKTIFPSEKVILVTIMLLLPSAFFFPLIYLLSFEFSVWSDINSFCAESWQCFLGKTKTQIFHSKFHLGKISDFPTSSTLSLETKKLTKLFNTTSNSISCNCLRSWHLALRNTNIGLIYRHLNYHKVHQCLQQALEEKCVKAVVHLPIFLPDKSKNPLIRKIKDCTELWSMLSFIRIFSPILEGDTLGKALLLCYAMFLWI